MKSNTAMQWGIVSGLMVFASMTLIGIVFRVEPFVIAQRSLCSAAFACIVAQLAIRAIWTIQSRKRRTWEG